MNKIKLYSGDLFCSSFPSAKLGGVITFVEKLRARDFHAEYSHAGIITNSAGDTFESLWTVKRQNLLAGYSGAKVLIVRYVELHPNKYAEVWPKIEKHEGEIYPVHRLVLHLTGLSKFVHWHRLVCSEMVAKFLYLVGARHKYWFGTNPDHLADEFRHWRVYKIIYEGVINPELTLMGGDEDEDFD